MKQVFSQVSILLYSLFAFSQNNVPEIDNLSVSFDDNNKLITVNFDLTDNESDNVDITVMLSDNYGETFLAEVLNVQGDAGYPVSPGNNKQITFNYNSSLQPTASWMIKIAADDKQAVDIQQIVDQVDSVRLRDNLTFIEGIRHYQTDSMHLEEVKDFIEVEFRKQGLITYRQNFTHKGYHAANIISWTPGLKDEKVTYIVDAHFDSVGNSPGADDNGSGVAGLLEAARILSQYKFEHTIKFIGFDFEESSPTFGLTGSLKYVSEGIKPHEQIEGVFNFEMIGYYSEKPGSQTMPPIFNTFFPEAYNELQADGFRGNFITNVADTPSAELGLAFADAAAQFVPALKVISLVSPDTIIIKATLMRSDHASFWFDSINALMLTDGANFRNLNYHSANDTFGTLNFTFMSNVVKATVAAVATLAKPIHASSETAYLIETGVQGVESGCNWQIAQSETHILFYPDRNCDLSTWTVRLYDTQGKIIFQKNYETEHLAVESSQLTPGLYFLSATNSKTVKSLPVMVR